MKKAVKKSVKRAGHKAVKKVVDEFKKRKVLDETPDEVVIITHETNIPVDNILSVTNTLSTEKVNVQLPVYDHCRVTEILPDGHNKTHYKCSATDRNGNKVTIHVPRSLFG